MVKQYDPHAGDNKITWPAAIPFDATDRATSGSGTSAAVTITGDAARPIILTQIHCSYTATPTGGKITVQDGATTVFEQLLAGAGPFEFNFNPPRSGTAGSNMVVTLAGGGGAIVGDLDVNAHKLL